MWIQILSSQTCGKLDLEDLQTPHILQGSSVAMARDIEKLEEKLVTSSFASISYLNIHKNKQIRIKSTLFPHPFETQATSTTVAFLNSEESWW